MQNSGPTDDRHCSRPYCRCNGAQAPSIFCLRLKEAGGEGCLIILFHIYETTSQGISPEKQSVGLPHQWLIVHWEGLGNARLKTSTKVLEVLMTMAIEARNLPAASKSRCRLHRWLPAAQNYLRSPDLDLKCHRQAQTPH